MNQDRIKYWQVFDTPWGPVTAVGANKLSAVLLREPSDQEKAVLGQEVTKMQPVDSNEAPVSFGRGGMAGRCNSFLFMGVAIVG